MENYKLEELVHKLQAYKVLPEPFRNMGEHLLPIALELQRTFRYDVEATLMDFLNRRVEKQDEWLSMDKDGFKYSIQVRKEKIQ